MNERDELLLKRIIGSIDDDLNGPILVNTSSTQFVRLNLILIKGLLEIKGLSGMFVSVDRPHQYMVHLLRMHKIKVDSVIFIDAIGRFSGDRKEAMASVGFVDAPFHIDTLPEAMKGMHTSDHKGLDLDQCGFAMIDNVAALLPYNSYPSVEAFMRNFVSVMKSKKPVLIPLVIDKEKNGFLYEMARSIAVKEIAVQDIISNDSNSSTRKISDIQFMQGAPIHDESR
jgi:hypothetical protein